MNPFPVYTAILRQWLLIISFFGILLRSGYGQVIYSNTFTGTGACPTQGNIPVMSSNATGTVLSRSSSLTCDTGADVFNSRGINNTATVNDASYIEFSVTANTGAQLNVISLSFLRQASASAPNQLDVRFSTNNFATSTSWGAAPLTPIVGTSVASSTITWDFPNFSVPPGTTLSFRFYPYGTQRTDLGPGASNGTIGTFRLDDVTLNGASPLPVNLVSFAGKATKKGVTLNWVTAWEEENRGFEIQKSSNARSFETVGSVEGKLNTNVQAVYEFIDTNVMPSQIYYYRLKQNDRSGASDLSEIISVRAGESVQEDKAVIFPNPNTGNFTLLGFGSESVSLTLYGPSGAEIPIDTEGSTERKALDIRARTFLPPGVYYLHVKPTDATKLEVLKVLIEP
ncbi:T9SS type A sorting domain-containing protein [Spirosoma sp.]|uniref:T9SS type A sorting domain-containing protein n=1 Tax=Spirosoma sp. TaxID=1899569 RepID=UPI00260B4D51|nr:T9SS type A sorting domain-containing protein [Spirosoma sp.]MCX6217008.1 T9SS type A sorting domain-containing protein [Spirosoma sp.]